MLTLNDGKVKGDMVVLRPLRVPENVLTSHCSRMHVENIAKLRRNTNV